MDVLNCDMNATDILNALLKSLSFGKLMVMFYGAGNLNLFLCLLQ